MNPKELDLFINSILIQSETATSLESLQRTLRAICPKENLQKVRAELEEDDKSAAGK